MNEPMSDERWKVLRSWLEEECLTLDERDEIATEMDRLREGREEARLLLNWAVEEVIGWKYLLSDNVSEADRDIVSKLKAFLDASRTAQPPTAKEGDT